MAIRAARRYLGDRLIRTARPHRLLDPDAGPLIAVRLHILTRKTLGGLQTDLDSRVLGADGQPVQGLYAAGEVAGFGGGGVHGYAALEGTFLGGCIFSGRAAGRAAAAERGLSFAIPPRRFRQRSANRPQRAPGRRINADLPRRGGLNQVGQLVARIANEIADDAAGAVGDEPTHAPLARFCACRRRWPQGGSRSRRATFRRRCP